MFFMSSPVCCPCGECLAGMDGWGRMKSRQRRIKFTAKTRLEGSLLHSHLLHTKLHLHLRLHCHRSTFFFSRNMISLIFFFIPITSSPILSLRLLQPPPFTPGQFFNLFEESVDTRIKPLWLTRSSATYRQSTRLLFGCATVQCNTI